MGVVALSAMTSCNDRLDVNNPNYFTDDQIMKEILMSGDETKIKKAMEGMANTMPTQIMVFSGNLTGGYSNVQASEISRGLAHSLLIGDIVEGSQVNYGTYYRYYTVDPTYNFSRYDNVAANAGNYYIAVSKVSAAVKVLKYLTDEVVGTSTLLREYRARCLTVLAQGYMVLMEFYTDLQDPSSTTAQGWPIYTDYAYNQAKEPLSVKETWDQIKSWLQQAVSDFEASGLGTGGYTVGSDVDSNYDVDLGVANFLLARVGLDTKDYQTTITACTSIMNKYPNFIKEENYGMSASLLPEVAKRDANGFVKSFNASENAFYCMEKNPEVIFGWNASGSTTSSTCVQLSAFPWYFENTLQQTGLAFFSIDQALYDQMSDNDYRKACYVTENITYPFYELNNSDTVMRENEITKYANLKFAATDAIGYTNHNISYTNSDICYYRSSAALLMLAEAYAQSGNDSAAKEWLNKLLAARTKSGATTMTCDNTMSGKSALEMCKLQWRIEMWGEGDWSFINAKRWNELPARAGSNHWSTRKVDLSDLIWEIPEIERQGNPYWKY